MSTKGEFERGTELDLDPPTQGDVFEVLSNERRRHVIRALRTHEEESVDLGQLAEQVAAWENDVEESGVTYDQRKRVYTALQQTHLPMMDKAGAIEFHKNRGTVDRVEQTDDFDYYLTVVPHGTLLFSHYYTTLGLLTTLFGVLLATGMLSIPFVPELVVPATVIGLFAVLSVFHLLHRNRSKWETHESGAPE